jgi:hypothetical protein
MAFYGKCRFCGENGHSVSMCSHNNLIGLLNDMHQEIETFQTRSEIRKYLYRLPPFHFDILAAELRLPVGMPRFMAYKTVENHYVSMLSIRMSRINRYELEVEENASTYIPPHSLFQRILEGAYSIGASVYRFVWRPTRSINTQDDIEMGRSQRRWSIAPKLKQVISFEKEECPICLEKKNSEIMITPDCLCHNSFCNECFMKYLHKHRTKEPACPICRNVFKKVDVYNPHLFNEYVRLFTKI